MTDCVKTWHCRQQWNVINGWPVHRPYAVFENRADRETAWRLHEVLLDQFIASFKRAPKKLILDFDATDDPVHGEQDGRFFHGYYRHYCFSATVCILRSSVAGELSSSEQHRWCQTQLGDFVVCWSKDCGKCGQRCGSSSAVDGGFFAAGKMLRWCGSSRGRLHHRDWLRISA